MDAVDIVIQKKNVRIIVIMKTKICTSLEQSKKLLELGIDVNTADMYYFDDHYNLVSLKTDFSYENYLLYKRDGCDYIPAWSLSALLELIPPYLGEFNEGIDFGFSKSMNKKWYSAHYIQLNDDGVATFNKTVTGDTAIDAAFEIVVWLKENGKL